MECKDSDVQSALSSTRMDDETTGLRNDFEAAVAFLLPTDTVPKKRKEKRTVSEIYATISYENKIQRKQNMTQIGKQGGNLKSGVRKTGVYLLYHKSAEYNFLTYPHKDKLPEN